jgi:HK97 family phage major capsid protein/HK97 family phage prohead protease
MKIQKRQLRTARAEDVSVENESLTFSFSSEFPVDRGWGMEILSHAPGAMDMTRLKTSAPLLFNHDRDLQLGVIEEAWIGTDRRGYCKVKLSRSDFAQDKLKDIQDKILVNVSFGYEIKSIVLNSDEAGKHPEYLVTEYMPYEVSFVTIPADYTVGLGRSIEEGGEIDLDEDDDTDADEQSDDDGDVDRTGDNGEDASSSDNDENENEQESRNAKENNITERNTSMPEIQEAVKAEKQRVKDILALAEKHGERELADKFIEDGKTPADFGLALVEKLGGRHHRIDSTPIDLSNKEKRQYSLSRAILAVVNKNWKDAGFEQEVSREIAKRAGKDTEGFYMPTNLQVRANPYLAGTAAQGGNLVQTTVLGDQFIDVLRARAVIGQMGAVMLTGLTGNIAIPRKNGRSAIYWIAEDGTITESEATFDQVAFSPKTAAALSQVTRQLLQQANMSVDAMIADDMNKEMALGIDGAAIYGTGASGQPKGILNQSGIGSVALGATGGALTFDAMIDLETAVATANADVASMKYLTNAKQVGVLKKIKTTTGAYLWSSTANGSPVGFGGVRGNAVGEINGYEVFRSNQVPSNLTKSTGSNLSAVVFGDWSQLVIAQWLPGIEILVNPYGDGYNKGAINLRALAMVDVNVRQPAAFAAITDAT